MDQYGLSAVDRPPWDRLREFPGLRSRAVVIKESRRISANDVENIITEAEKIMKLGVFDEQYFADICELDVDPLFVLENEAVAADGLLPVSRALGLTGL